MKEKVEYMFVRLPSHQYHRAVCHISQHSPSNSTSTTMSIVATVVSNRVSKVVGDLPKPSRTITDLAIVEILTVRIPFEKLRARSRPYEYRSKSWRFHPMAVSWQVHHVFSIALPLILNHSSYCITPLIKYHLPIKRIQRITSYSRFTVYLQLHSPTP